MREFSGGLVVRILGFHCHGPGSDSGWGTEILMLLGMAKKEKKKKKKQKTKPLQE